MKLITNRNRKKKREERQSEWSFLKHLPQKVFPLRELWQQLYKHPDGSCMCPVSGGLGSLSGPTWPCPWALLPCFSPAPTQGPSPASLLQWGQCALALRPGARPGSCREFCCLWRMPVFGISNSLFKSTLDVSVRLVRLFATAEKSGFAVDLYVYVYVSGRWE